ncbi:hypothetical protein [Rhodopila sp.]|uniref:hypothetical protein n=1 Tax=Rhodopila sp. TaxID=2480087 RepID=UPI003D0C37EC
MTRRHDARHTTPRGRSRAARPATPSAQPTVVNNVTSDPQDEPRFAQPEITADPAEFQIKHSSDSAAYKVLDAMARAHELRPIPFPAARGGAEPVLTFAQILGSHGADATRQVTDAGRLVFHSVGDTGNTRGPSLQDEVAAISPTNRRIGPGSTFTLAT